VLELPSAVLVAAAASLGAEPSWPDCASAAALAADDPLAFAPGCELRAACDLPAVDELDLPLESAESAAGFGLLEAAGLLVEDDFDAVDECLLAEAAALAAACDMRAASARSCANRSVSELCELDDLVVPVE
jgi:hypothetical protein